MGSLSIYPALFLCLSPCNRSKKVAPSLTRSARQPILRARRAQHRKRKRCVFGWRAHSNLQITRYLTRYISCTLPAYTAVPLFFFYRRAPPSFIVLVCRSCIGIVWNFDTRRGNIKISLAVIGKALKTHTLLKFFRRFDHFTVILFRTNIYSINFNKVCVFIV